MDVELAPYEALAAVAADEIAAGHPFQDDRRRCLRSRRSRHPVARSSRCSATRSACRHGRRSSDAPGQIVRRTSGCSEGWALEPGPRSRLRAPGASSRPRTASPGARVPTRWCASRRSRRSDNPEAGPVCGCAAQARDAGSAPWCARSACCRAAASGFPGRVLTRMLRTPSAARLSARFIPTGPPPTMQTGTDFIASPLAARTGASAANAAQYRKARTPWQQLLERHDLIRNPDSAIARFGWRADIGGATCDCG